MIVIGCAVIAVIAIVVAIAAIRAGGTKAKSAAGNATASGQPSTASREAAAFPSADNTGVPTATSLQRVPAQVTRGSGWHWNGSTAVIDRDGVSLKGLDIDGPVSSKYAHLTIEQTRIRCTNENDWCLILGTQSTVTQVDIGGGENGTTYGHAIGIYTGGSDAGNLITRTNVHHQIHGLRIDGGTTLTDSYIHELVMGDPVVNLQTGKTTSDDHTDAVMMTRGANVAIRHNRIEGGNTACIFVQWDVTDSTSPKIGSVVVENNLIINVHRHNQDSSLGVNVEDRGIVGPITIRNNTFSRSGWTVGPINAPSAATVTGNVFIDGGPAR
jgi:hypothetical protein